ncbi:MAG: ATP-binding protein [Ignavibacteriaceae bacterium]
MFIERKILPGLVNHFNSKQVTVITGMRRVGKTTLLKELLKSAPEGKSIFIDLERIDNRELFDEKNYENILQNLRRRGLKTESRFYIGIDEIQFVPNLPSVLKYFYDNYDVKFIVTGSSSYYIKNLFIESLAGRKTIFELFPLDFGEYLRFKGIPYVPFINFSNEFNNYEYTRLKDNYDEYIKFGGFPDVVLEQTEKNKIEFLNDLINSYLTVDIRALSDFRNEKNIYNLIKILSARAGTRLDYTKIASISGLSRPTVMNYLELFQKSYLIDRVEVFTRNRDKEIIKAPKLYFTDNGILNRLAEVSSGVQFENAVYNQLKHLGEVRYYSLKTGKEIDFVLSGAATIEVKETPTLSDMKQFQKLSSGLDVNKNYLVGRYKTPNFSAYTWGGEIQ